MSGLFISKDIGPLPLDAVTGTFAVLAIRGAGKTYTASVLAEEYLRAGLRICVVDPTDVWWGLRANADGEPSGLPVVIFGGRKADVPLEEDDGARVADIVVDQGISCILSTKHFETDASRVRFLLAFARRLYFRNTEPLHLFLDEADDYIPQVVTGDVAKLVGAWVKIVRHGRAQGLGCTLITQRSASLNKNVLSQIETLVALRTTSPHDADAVKDWMRAAGKLDDGVLATLPKLANGEAWIWSPSYLQIDPPRRVHIRERRTFNSSATPKVGEKRIEPRALTPVSIDAIRSALAAGRKPEPKGPVTFVSTPTAAIDALERELRDAVARAVAAEDLASRRGKLLGEIAHLAGADPGAMVVAPPPPHRVTVAEHEPFIPKPGATIVTLRPPPSGDSGERRMLVALVQFGTLTRAQVATLAGVSPKGGSFRTYLSNLSKPGYVAKDGNALTITERGRAAAGVVPPRPSSTADLVSMWRSRFDAGPQRMLDLLVGSYPTWIERDRLAQHLGLDPKGGSWRTYLSKLAVNGLMEKQGSRVRAGSALFPEVVARGAQAR